MVEPTRRHDLARIPGFNACQNAWRSTPVQDADADAMFEVVQSTPRLGACLRLFICANNSTSQQPLCVRVQDQLVDALSAGILEAEYARAENG